MLVAYKTLESTTKDMSLIIWQDREVRFDIPAQDMKLCLGEKLIDTLKSVEDSKGNSGGRGKLLVTNLRLIWRSYSVTRVNLSVGWNCIQKINPEIVNLKLRGITEAIRILTKTDSARFEFIFTNLIPECKGLFISLIGVYKAYASTKLYRDLKLRGAILQDKQLRILPNEQICSKCNGVWYLCNDRGNLGAFVITNLRLVWYANMSELFNISLPYLQMISVKITDSKYGMGLHVQMPESSDGSVLGFKIDPYEKLQEVYKEISSLFTVFSNNPYFGIEYTIDNKSPDPTVSIDPVQDDIAIETTDVKSDAYIAYLADGNHQKDREPIYSEELGLAIEKPKEGFTLASLWEVVPT